MDQVVAGLEARLEHYHGLDRLAPFFVGYADHHHLSNGFMGRQYVFHLPREDVEAAGDDHVLGPVHDVKEAILVQPAHIAGVQPAAGECLGGFGGHVLVAFHDQRAAHADLTRLSRGHFITLRVPQRQVYPRAGASTGGQAFRFRRVVVTLSHIGDHHGRFGLAEELVEDRTPLFDALGQAGRAHGGSAVEDGLHAGHVGGCGPGGIQQEIEHHGDQHGTGDTVLLDHVEKLVRAEALHDVEGPAVLQHRNEECRGGMGEWRRYQHAQFVGELPLGHLDLGHIGGNTVGAHHALRLAGGAAGEVDRGNFMGEHLGDDQRLWLEGVGQGQVVVSRLGGTESEQVL